ncbi:BA75_04409T0 [Komagataella pastoris]|uniref:BA75_04409T0 n=1 Tax=Komagataella pastoris TaxID=4922 RepID=A0A1B2JIM6_PICPA|nr:BA75_04409T0 [Komagataella pastoris]
MSLNCVILNDDTASDMRTENSLPFIQLPGELVVYRSPDRTSLQITIPHSLMTCNSLKALGNIYVTNQRVLMITSASRGGDFQSFNLPYRIITQSELVTPWIGATRWRCSFIVVNPLECGLPLAPNQIHNCSLEIVFNEGGFVEFVKEFETFFCKAGRSAYTEEENLPAYRESDNV